MNEQYLIKSEAELTDVLGEPKPHITQKIVTALDQPMSEFIERSPLIFVSTIDEEGGVDVSPKGDAPGFVGIADGQILIPERPGNKLAMGFKNILRNPQVGVIFVIPGTRETLRVKGLATISRDPALLSRLEAQGKPAILCITIDVKTCFFHCGKAMIRSKLWQPESWGEDAGNMMVRQIAMAVAGDESLAPAISENLEQSYKDNLY